MADTGSVTSARSDFEAAFRKSQLGASADAAEAAAPAAGAQWSAPPPRTMIMSDSVRAPISGSSKGGGGDGSDGGRRTWRTDGILSFNAAALEDVLHGMTETLHEHEEQLLQVHRASRHASSDSRVDAVVALRFAAVRPVGSTRAICIPLLKTHTRCVVG